MTKLPLSSRAGLSALLFILAALPARAATIDWSATGGGLFNVPGNWTGAALALAATGDDDHKRRIRIAADACASEPMRIALGRLADGHVDEAAVEEALAAEKDASHLEKQRTG